MLKSFINSVTKSKIMPTKLHFWEYNPKQIVLLLQQLDKDIAENDPVCIVDIVVDNP